MNIQFILITIEQYIALVLIYYYTYIYIPYWLFPTDYWLLYIVKVQACMLVRAATGNEPASVKFNFCGFCAIIPPAVNEYCAYDPRKKPNTLSPAFTPVQQTIDNKYVYHISLYVYVYMFTYI